MADKDRISFLCSDKANVEEPKQGNNKENASAGLKTVGVEWDTNQQNQQRAPKLTVYERNYQFARIYENKRCALKAEKDAVAKNQRQFKASPMPIAQSPPKTQHLPKFTIPCTPLVLKRTPHYTRKN